MSATEEDDEFGDELIYDSELDETLRAAETLPDIEDAAQAISPFDEFRRRGNLSVSDLVGTVWCEVQFDYRLRTLPFLPVSKRPTTIKSTKGASIAVDQAKVEGKERILKRGETIHKRLEREIHPVEVIVKATTREDTWGLRMLTMFSAIEALITIGKCRELPVAGFVNDTFVLGIIDEIKRVPIVESPTRGRQTRARRTESGRQASLNDFFGGKPLPQPQTHRLFVSDSKTRTSGSLPREEDTLAGRLQVMLYKELLDALLKPREADIAPRDASEVDGGEVEMGGEENAEPPDLPPDAYLPSASPQGSGLWRIWEHLELDTSAHFTDDFIAQTRLIVESNDLRFGVGEGRTLADYGRSWSRYVAALGLGAGPDEGKTDNALELVYRRAAPKRKKETARKRRKEKGKGRRRREAAAAPYSSEVTTLDIASVEVAQRGALHVASVGAANHGELDEDTQVQLALQLSLQGDRAASSQILGVETATSASRSIEEPSYTFPGSQPKVGEQHSLSVAVVPEPETIPAVNDTATEMELASHPSGSEAAPQPSLNSAVSSSALGLGLPTPSQLTYRSFSSHTKYYTSDSEQEREDAELAWAVEMSLASQDSAPSGVGVKSPQQRKPRTRSPSPAASGSIIGKHRFTHDPTALGTHLRSVLQYWRGTREPRGVGPTQVRRCHWCEFEDGCEWRQAKAAEAMERYQSQRIL
ncbi:hypothetical protein CC85DRAFT_299911 [Cutaneotrichosporon oleaginosum]|uniref:Exonuclease V n=1 Tax=Cutaneotrichosporon oleaginosum TaxID=879819 RepID=A0A0J0XVE2_9TREE|nr:uncharacterized protein CC85DRAFT_299911 [Cutaneotrichosporon oleaginosum]KLT45040.1 hypothetical protein CC85DRAFT_299911 [Cutaneotrichosporon oleaginosum]TXT09726.1 hypothetical protein COLE_03660 [Cutaneotrichosporon oleaginosum]